MRQRLPRINARADLPTQAMWSPSLFPQPSSYRAASSLQEAGTHHGPYLGIKLPDRTEESVPMEDSHVREFYSSRLFLCISKYNLDHTVYPNVSNYFFI